MSLDPVPDELNDLKDLDKILISKRLILKKITVMHEKAQFPKIKGSICSIPIETAYMQYFAKTCRFKWIYCGKIKKRS